MEERRRCALAGFEGRDGEIVWGSGAVVSGQCPRSVVSGQSEAWVEVWPLWRLGRGSAGWAAKDLEAMAVMEREWRRVEDEQRRA